MHIYVIHTHIYIYITEGQKRVYTYIICIADILYMSIYIYIYIKLTTLLVIIHLFYSVRIIEHYYVPAPITETKNKRMGMVPTLSTRVLLHLPAKWSNILMPVVIPFRRFTVCSISFSKMIEASMASNSRYLN